MGTHPIFESDFDCLTEKLKMAPPPRKDDSDEDEYYKRPTLAERIGPEEARRMLMDDDDEEEYQSKEKEDDEKSMKSEQSAAGASEKSSQSLVSGKSHQSAKSAMSAVSAKSAMSTKSGASGVSIKSGMSAASAKSGVSAKSAISAVSGVSSTKSGLSAKSDMSRLSQFSKASKASNITTASERSNVTTLTDVVDEDYYAVNKADLAAKKEKKKSRRREVVAESESDCESEKSDVSAVSVHSASSQSSIHSQGSSVISSGSAISAHSRHSLSSHLSGRSATSAASEDSKVVSRFARGVDLKDSDKKDGPEVTMTSDITSDHQSTAITSAMESDSVHSGTDTEIENEDLSEVRAGSAILPNLTIAIERDDDPGIVISFIKLKGPAPSTDTEGDSIIVVRNNKKLLKASEEEWNMARGIPVLGLGIDKHSPEQLKKQKQRAKRFGLDVNKNMEDGEIDDSEINPVGETLIMEMAKRIEDHNNENSSMENIDRMIVDKTLTVIGCNELHTKDILAFFKNFKPDKVAWVDDARVKLTWHQQSASIRCLMASTQSTEKLKKLNLIAKKRYETRGEKPPSDGENEADDQMETNDITCPLTGALNPERHCLETLIDSKGKNYKLELRFALKSDEKGNGAQSKSKYYVKFGNPNYGNMRGLLSKSFKRRYMYKKTRDEIQSLERFGMKMKSQTSKYDPKNENLDTNRHAADDELINSSVQDIPEAIPVDRMANRMLPPSMAPPSGGYTSDQSGRSSTRSSSRYGSDSERTTDSERSRRNSSRWDSSSNRSDSESDVPKKPSLKSRLGLPKKKNERTGITITLSRSKEERSGSKRTRKRSYDVESDTSDVSSRASDKDVDYRRMKNKDAYYEDSDTESVKSGTSMASSHVSAASSRVSETSAVTEASSAITESSAATSSTSDYKRRRTDDESYESDSSATSHASGSSHASRHSHTSHTSGTSGTSRTTATSQSEYDSDTAQSDSAQSEVSYIGRRDSQKAHPSATICKLAAVKNHASKRRPMFGPASGKFDRRKSNEINMTIDVQVDRGSTSGRSDASGVETD